MSAQAISLDQWQLRFHEAMAVVLRASETIRREAGIPGIAFGLWNVARILRNLIPIQQHLYESMLALPEGVVDEALVKRAAESTAELVRSIEGLLDNAKRHGLTNRTLTAASLESIRRHGEEIAEHLDALRLSIDPDVEASIRQGRQDFAEGHGVRLESLLEE